MDLGGKKLIIGPSTGWLYAQEIYSLDRQKAVLTEAGANCVEIVLSGWGDKRMISLETGGRFNARTFPYRSLHLPDINNRQFQEQLAMARRAIASCGSTVALTHPLKVNGGYPTESYKGMILGGVPLAIENMDSKKESDFDLTELENLMKEIVGCRFVLDVQHAFEHDPEMKCAKDLFELMKDKLAHLHVSGETSGSNHSLVCKATNCAKIVDFVGQVLAVKQVPLILEGEYKTADELRREIEFLTKELYSG